MKQRAAETIQEIDRILEEGDLEEAAVDELVELMTPGESAPWPELEAVLHLAEHEAIASDLQMHALPDRLEQAIGEALEAVLPLLGVRPYGPTFKIAEIARREFDAETEKFELVCERLEAVDEDEGARLVARYLETEPAPMFVNRMRKRHPSIVDRASEMEGRAPALEDYEPRSRVAGALASAEALRSADPSDLRDDLEAADDPLEVATQALASDRAEDQLLGGALVKSAGLTDLVPTVLRRVTEGTEAAPQLAVFAARTAAEETRHGFSTFLAEVSLQNPELPEAELTESRVRAILSARTVLPRVGSPMDPVDVDELPSLGDHEQLSRIPGEIDAFWEAWSEAMAD